MAPPLCADSGMYFFTVARINNLGFLVSVPTQVLTAAVTVGREFPFQCYVASGTDIMGMTIRENHYFFNLQFYAVYGKEYKQLPER